MTSQGRDCIIHQSAVKATGLENVENNPNEVSLVQWEENIPNSPIAHLNFSPEDNGSRANQELQTLWEIFTSWLKPESQSKEQMISQLVLEQFLKTGHCKHKIALRKKWESTGRDTGGFIEALTDECLKPPTMIHVSLNGQEALFSENMSLKEVIKVLKQQESEKKITQENARTDFQNTQYMLFVRENIDSQDGQCNPWNTREVHGGVNSPGNTMDFLSINQTEQFPNHEKESVSEEIPQDFSKTGQESSRNQEECQRETPSADVSMEEEHQSIIIQTEPTEDLENHNTESTGEGHQERLHQDPETYNSEKNPRACKDDSNHSTQQKTQKKERSFLCDTCPKGFYTKSDLGVHKMIHKRVKPFKCRTCKRGFSHKTNLTAHERIHTGEKPYTCPSCNRAFRQSSTYHRHKRKCVKSG